MTQDDSIRMLIEELDEILKKTADDVEHRLTDGNIGHVHCCAMRARSLVAALFTSQEKK